MDHLLRAAEARTTGDSDVVRTDEVVLDGPSRAEVLSSASRPRRYRSTMFQRTCQLPATCGHVYAFGILRTVQTLNNMFLLDLPLDALVKILLFLGGRDIVKCMMVSTSLMRFAQGLDLLIMVIYT